MIPLPFKTKVVMRQGNRGVFEVEGLYPGYGQTIGNSMRRVLLSSLEGAAITSVKIEGVGHEFSAMDGISEDVVEITLNLKRMRFRMYEPGPFAIALSVKGEREILGKDFHAPSQVEIITPDIHIATLTSKKSSLVMEVVVERGLGYVPVEARGKEKVEIGTIALDAAFSPVRHVHYEIENMRVGDRTDYNRLRLDITTDGSLTPEEAFEQASHTLVEQFSAVRERLTRLDEAEGSAAGADKGEGGAGEAREEDTAQEFDTLKIKLEDTKISSRTLNALREGGIKTVGGLARKREETLRKLDGIGDKGIQEIKKTLGGFGMTLK